MSSKMENRCSCNLNNIQHGRGTNNILILCNEIPFLKSIRKCAYVSHVVLVCNAVQLGGGGVAVFIAW
jgi:hypothetical protein